MVPEKTKSQLLSILNIAQGSIIVYCICMHLTFDNITIFFSVFKCLSQSLYTIARTKNILIDF